MCSVLPQSKALFPFCGRASSHALAISISPFLVALPLSDTGHLNRGVDSVFEIVRIVGHGLVSIAAVHAIIARAYLTQSEPEMARD